jgi:hypothetical protein
MYSTLAIMSVWGSDGVQSGKKYNYQAFFNRNLDRANSVSVFGTELLPL